MNANTRCAMILAALLCPTTCVRGNESDAYNPPAAGQVRIVRDRFGVPHIIARDDYSLFFGAGYAQAEDQIENLYRNILRAEGRIAEQEGPSALSTDYLMRAMRIPQRAAAQYEALDPASREHLDGFAAGVNAYLAEKRDQVAPWVKPVKPQDILAFYNYIDVIFAIGSCRGDLDAAGVRIAKAFEPSGGGAYGSNQFAVAPSRSTSGRAMLSMDPHLPHSGFYRWYEMHMVGPEINVMGCCFFGSPYLSMGHTPYCAWSMTVNAPDLGDVFAFEVNPENPNQYRDLEGFKPFEFSQERFAVLENDQIVERELPVKHTSMGPVMAEKNGRAYVFMLPWSDSPSRVRQLHDMARAQNLEAFRKAMSALALVMFNVVYADRDGQIFYVSNGRIGRRDARIAPNEIRPGHEAWARWQGFHPFDELPQVTNPTCGFLMNTNSGPGSVCPDQAPDPSKYPGYMFGQQPNSRSRRLNAILTSDKEITFDELRTYATDTYVEATDRLLPGLIQGLRQSAAGDAAALNEVAQVLEGWDRRTELDSRGAVLFFYLVSSPKFLDLLKQSDNSPDARQQLAKLAVKQSGIVRRQFGQLDAPWEKFSHIRRGDTEVAIAGNGSREAVLGQFTTLRPTYGVIEGGRRLATGGTSYAMVVNFSDPIEAWSILPYGISESTASSHFADQMPLYAARQYKRAWFWPAELAENTESQRELTAARP